MKKLPGHYHLRGHPRFRRLLQRLEAVLDPEPEQVQPRVGARRALPPRHRSLDRASRRVGARHMADLDDAYNQPRPMRTIFVRVTSEPSPSHTLVLARRSHRRPSASKAPGAKLSPTPPSNGPHSATRAGRQSAPPPVRRLAGDMRWTRPMSGLISPTHTSLPWKANSPTMGPSLRAPFGRFSSFSAHFLLRNRTTAVRRMFELGNSISRELRSGADSKGPARQEGRESRAYGFARPHSRHISSFTSSVSRSQRLARLR